MAPQNYSPLQRTGQPQQIQSNAPNIEHSHRPLILKLDELSTAIVAIHREIKEIKEARTQEAERPRDVNFYWSQRLTELQEYTNALKDINNGLSKAWSDYLNFEKSTPERDIDIDKLVKQLQATLPAIIQMMEGWNTEFREQELKARKQLQ